FNTVSQETGVYARRNILYNMLPDTFTKKDYDTLVSSLGENGSTANKWIEAFIKDGKLSRIEQGKYRKIF
ncbi:DNA primase, partial [Bacteroides uniformis]